MTTALLAALAQAVPFALIGTAALRRLHPVALAGYARAETDLDLLVQPATLPALVDWLQAKGFAVTSWGQPWQPGWTAADVAGRRYVRATRGPLTLDATFECPFLDLEAAIAGAKRSSGVPICGEAAIWRLKWIKDRAACRAFADTHGLTIPAGAALALRPMLTDLAARPGALSVWLGDRIEIDDPDLPEAVAWLGEHGRARLLLQALDHWTAHCEPAMLDAIRASCAGLEDALCGQLGEDLTADGPEVRRAAARDAGLLGLAGMGEALTAALLDPYFLTRMEAAVSLGTLGITAAIPELRLSIRDKDLLVREAVITALFVLPDPDLAFTLTGGFIDDGAAYAFGVLDDADTRVHHHALQLLETHRPACAVAVLGELIAGLEAWQAEEEEPLEPESLAVLAEARAVLGRLWG